MKNGVDFIYEYSDLNLFQTRVKILTGKYKGLILEFGGSCLVQIGSKNTFTFDYTLYEVPENFSGPQLRKEPEFNEFLAYLLVDIVETRNNDPKEKEKLQEAASKFGVQNPSIKISSVFYLQKPKKHSIAQGL